MSTPPLPSLPSREELEGAALVLIGAVAAGDEEVAGVVSRYIERNVEQGVPWAAYAAGLIVVLIDHLLGLLAEQGTDPAEWVAARQAEHLDRRWLAGTEDGG